MLPIVVKVKAPYPAALYVAGADAEIPMMVPATVPKAILILLHKKINYHVRC
jgi:hypothetical protein